jgi:hypothetical protein
MSQNRKRIPPDAPVTNWTAPVNDALPIPDRVHKCHLVREKDPRVDTQALIFQIYAAFNKRDIDGTLALMSENVSWPKASEGGRVIGKQAIREYWARQWAEFDPLVNVLEVINRESGVTDVKVHQLVKDLKGNILSDTELWHVYSFTHGLIDRMEIKEGEGILDGPSTAFTVTKHAT